MFAGGRGSLGRIVDRIIPPGRPFYGWRLVVAVAVIAALGNGELVDQAFEGYWLPGWHLLKLPALLMPAAGWLIARRWGARRTMLTGLPIVGIGLLAAGLWGKETGYLVALAPVAIGSTLGGWLPAATIINDHFRRRPATAQAMLLSGGLIIGGLLAYGPPLLLPGVNDGNISGRALAIAAGALVLTIAIPLARRIPDPPTSNPPVSDLPMPDPSVPDLPTSDPPVSDPPTSDPTDNAGNIGDTDDGAGRHPSRAAPEYTLREALRSRDFWLLLVGWECVGIAVVSGLLGAVHTPAEYARPLDIPYFYIGYMVMSAIALPAGGLLGDRLGLRRTLRLLSLLPFAGTALLLMPGSGSPAFSALAGILLAAGNSGFGGPSVAAVGAYFGRRNFALLTGIGALPAIATQFILNDFIGLTATLLPGVGTTLAMIAALAGALAYRAVGHPQPASSQRGGAG